MSQLITLEHGSGGQKMQSLIKEMFLHHFNNEQLNNLEDQARIPLDALAQQGDRLAFATDSFVIDPIFFPGGNIGKLAVCGTVNDLAVGGAIPKYLSVGFVLEEGLPMTDLEQIVIAMAQTAKEAGVSIVTGDTKVVARGACDKIFINTAGIGVIPSQCNVATTEIQNGDKIIVTGTLGDHAVAILQARNELALSGSIVSDCAPLNLLTQPLLQHPGVHAMRDATRGGVAAVCNEIADQSKLGMIINEASLPLHPEVTAVSEILGLDPLLMANEGKAVIFVDAKQAESLLATIKSLPFGQDATIIGNVVNSVDGVFIESLYGAQKKLFMPTGEQLPRIC
ncbi:hydrogenase expression/formation protein HypE [Vibrio gallicus]|uniref:hydrogenase expression/formation protein HypE n=1 Tax=Vibrio gallicus TaxID=190897 RepID=UPI0021C3F1BF|nr:hydrogenase expression/formation protein HypE [Vibrio gallicus]